MSEQNHYVYEFGPFCLDATKRLLWRDGETVKLSPKDFDTLLALVEHSGEVLDKDALMKRLWGDTIVEEGNLATYISHLRKALGERPNEHEYIVTVPGQGYRFVAGVRQSFDELIVHERTRAELTVEEEKEVAPEGNALNLMAPHSASRLWLPVLLACALLAVAAAGYYFPAKRTAPPAPAPIKSIAVLPFKPLAAEGRDESLELGMADTLITRLSGIKEIAVRPVSAVRKYNALEQDALAAGQEQRVDAVLDGSIQKTDGRVRVTVRLVRMSDGQTLWADKFDARLVDIFALQDSISERVASAMAVKLSGKERELLTRHYTDNTEAYQLYLKGRLFYQQWSEESIHQALACFDRAIVIDPNYALAYAGKADVYAGNSSVFLAPAEAMPKAREAARKALEIDDRLAEAHFSMARVKLWADWDWAGAESEFKRALELKPNDAEARISYGGS